MRHVGGGLCCDVRLRRVLSGVGNLEGEKERGKARVRKRETLDTCEL